jgi:hypothetical protein
MSFGSCNGVMAVASEIAMKRRRKTEEAMKRMRRGIDMVVALDVDFGTLGKSWDGVAAELEVRGGCQGTIGRVLRCVFHPHDTQTRLPGSGDHLAVLTLTFADAVFFHCDDVLFLRQHCVRLNFGIIATRKGRITTITSSDLSLLLRP